jgi:hypothetical protein
MARKTVMEIRRHIGRNQFASLPFKANQLSSMRA